MFDGFLKSMRRRVPASYTIEAAYVMAVVFMTLASIILAAYRVHDETAGSMAVQETVEKTRHLEELWPKDDQEVRQVYLKNRYEITAKEKAGWFGEQMITGSGNGKGWKLEIQRKAYDPEGFLRMQTLMEDGILNNRNQEKEAKEGGEVRNGYPISKRNET